MIIKLSWAVNIGLISRETGTGTPIFGRKLLRENLIFLLFLSHLPARNSIFNHTILLSKVHAIIYENFIFGGTIPLRLK